MIIYRLCNEEYKDDISGTGAKLTGGRWNTAGIPALYSAEHISLAVLEILVNTNTKLIPISYYLLKLEIPDSLIPLEIIKEKLKKDWKNDIEYTQWMGTTFCKAGKAVFLKVPSAIIDEEHNYIFNPLHNKFKNLKVLMSKRFNFDNRLF
jgi:RES domain-containing protein